MAPIVQKRMTSRKILVRDLNPCITCSLCRGYFVDATSLVDCLHVFCRACILRYFENFKLACPTCNVVYKKKSNPCFRSDPIVQSLVYKLVPGLYSKEVQRREDFYRSTGVRASSSCSEDSVLGDLSEEHDEWMLSTCGDQNQYLSPDDAISLSLEYYQPHLDTTQNQPSNTKSTNSQDRPERQSDEKPGDLNNSANSSAEKTQTCDNSSNTDASENNDGGREKVQQTPGIEGDSKSENASDFPDKKKGDRRYLQCPAAVTMSLLQKFLRMKYALSAEHRVDIIHSGEVLPPYFSLMDVAYTFKWERTKPMRFFYRIFTPAKIQPIKIISTSSLGGKQLQVVPATPNPTQTLQPTELKPETTKDALQADSDAQNHRNKERLMANLQLQSKTKFLEKCSEKCDGEQVEKKQKVEPSKSSDEPEEGPDCVYEYEEPDKDEIRAFAEKRDREWALQKQLDEEKEKHRNSKKRKKSKHSKGNLLYKKRKLHAEITSSEEKEESLKLKVKLTPHNGYKHKHHKSSQSQVFESSPKQPELSSKEKLLQMRQVRHKHISIEDKSKASNQNNNNSSSNSTEETTEKPTVKCKEETKPPDDERVNKAENANKTVTNPTEPSIKIVEPAKKPQEPPRKPQEPPRKPQEPSKKPQEPARKPQEPPAVSSKATQSSTKALESSKPAVKEPMASSKTLRSDFAIKTNATKELCMQKYPTVQLERNEQTERQAQKTFLKTFQSYTEKLSQNTEKAPQVPKARPIPQNTYPGKTQNTNLQATKSLEQKIANLHQHCTTVEAKPAVRQDVPRVEKRPSAVSDKPQILNSQYSSGFTVSKVEAGVKRKLESDHNQDKRPSLEITLINPSPVEKPNPAPEVKPVAKRPPPPTIPLERIKKSMNRMSSISITPKLSDRCDNTGALDLSKPSRSVEGAQKPSEIHNKILNGLSLLAGRPPERVQTPDKNIQLSNLQMLSKVALEHPNINKNPGMTPNKRPQMPNLQTLKIPVVFQNSTPKANLPKLPKLNEISKAQFRMPNPQLRNMRPNQNQSVRNIPNPSLLVRQQNQNRLNSLSCSQNSSESKEQPAKQTSSIADGGSSPKGENKEKTTKEEKDQNRASAEKKVSS